MADEPGADAPDSRDADGLVPEARLLKRKKTVTWADDELELPLGPWEEEDAALAAGAAADAQPAVVVLPCDGLFDGLGAEMLQEQQEEEAPPLEGGEALTRRQLLERRLARGERLAALYESELWALLEELRLRHRQFTTAGHSVWRQPRADTAVDGGAAGAGEAAAAAEAGAVAGEQQRQQQQPVDAPPGASLRALWEQQQAAAEQAAGPATAGADQQQPQPQQAGAAAPPRFEDVEAWILNGGAARCPPPDEAALVAHRRRFLRQLPLLGRLEQGAVAATCRELDALGGLAALCGRRRRFVLRRAAVAIGRCTESRGKVDVDLSEECPEAAQRISRQQARLFLQPDGAFRLRCTGRRALLVNGRPLARGQTAALPSLSHIRAGDVSLLFVANAAAVARALQRSAQLAA